MNKVFFMITNNFFFFYIGCLMWGFPSPWTCEAYPRVDSAYIPYSSGLVLEHSSKKKVGLQKFDKEKSKKVKKKKKNAKSTKKMSI